MTQNIALLILVLINFIIELINNIYIYRISINSGCNNITFIVSKSTTTLYSSTFVLYYLIKLLYSLFKLYIYRFINNKLHISIMRKYAII